LLNHGCAIPTEASLVNGYTSEILERDGSPPSEVYLDFAAYAGSLPVVAFNLEYDWGDVLLPEWQRLGISQIGVPGFCALKLAQRLLDPVPAGNCKLQTLRQYYRLPENGAHTALGDVLTVVDLMQQVLKPLAERRGLDTWEKIVGFTGNEWFPSRVLFGKFKGRRYQEAREDAELMS
jgi:DNA polymerase-3 subunit epsilon